MAITTKVTRLSGNPRRVVARRRKSNPKRRHMTAKQIKHFGTKAQKAALKRKRAASRAARPVHRVRTASRRPAAKRRSTNPALIVTLAPVVNPHKRSNTTMPAKRKRRTKKRVAVVNRRRRRVVAKNPHRRRTRRASPKVVVRYRTRRKTNRRRRVSVRRNPAIFGSRLGSKESLKLIGGGLAGVAATKFLPTMIPANMAPQLVTTQLGRVAVSFAAAWISGWVASKLDSKFGDGVYFGGFMQVGSVALNTFLPAVYKMIPGGGGLGDFAPGQFAVPQNPLRIAAPGAHSMAPSGSMVRTSNLGRAYNPAY
jgi:hypothetical protein